MLRRNLNIMELIKWRSVTASMYYTTMKATQNAVLQHDGGVQKVEQPGYVYSEHN